MSSYRSTPRVVIPVDCWSCEGCTGVHVFFSTEYANVQLFFSGCSTKTMPTLKRVPLGDKPLSTPRPVG